MRILINIAILICALNSVSAQINIVHNGSMEQYSQCPNSYDEIKFATHWSAIDTTNSMLYCAPEYCNVCSPSGHTSIPYNANFHQYPRTGNGMVQTKLFFDESAAIPVKVDYLQGRLYKRLTSGKLYCVTFYVVLEEASGYANNNFGAYLDNGSIDNTDSVSCASPQVAYTPQINDTNIVIDTLRWTKIQGSFIANGTEKFITIGNFFDKAHTKYLRPVPSTNAYSYYLIDDVSVIESNAKADAGLAQVIEEGDSVHIGTNEEGMPCTWYVLGDTMPIGYSGGIWVKPDTTTTYVVEMDLCGNVTRDSVRVWVWPLGTKPLTPKGEPAMWPNPVNNELHVSSAAGSVFSVYDITGREVYKQVISSESEIINIESLQKGIYLIHIVDPVSGVRVTRKIVKE